jgi:hypothetical protein
MRLAFIVCAGLAAAPAYGQTPSCSDTRTIELVKSIFEQAIERRAAGMPRSRDIASGVVSKSSVAVQSIRTVRIDETIGKHFCQGVMEIELSPRGLASLNAPDGQAWRAKSFDTRDVRIAGNKATYDIRFTSQLAEDGKRHLVEMGGFQGLAEIAFKFTTPEVADQLGTGK